MRRALDESTPEGLRLLPGLISAEEERALAEACGRLPLTAPVMHGIPARRRTGHFGWLYGYDSAKIEPGPPVPDFLAPLCDRIAPLLGRAPDELLVTEYMPGAGIGWHRDAPAFGPIVVGVSLLGACRMRFQRGEAEARRTSSLLLEPRTAYVLAGEARSAWQHSIPAVKALRYSITFRSLNGSVPKQRVRRSRID
jgi:alkylated DNA repair protein (DNA oxidative demethylase)